MTIFVASIFQLTPQTPLFPVLSSVNLVLITRFIDRLCALLGRVPGYRLRGLSSIPGTTNFLRSSGSGTGFTQPRQYNEGATRKKL
jgi:hypothetical protein